MTDLKTTAEAFARALDLGFVTTAEVQAWVDRQIQMRGRPPDALLEACWAGGSYERLVEALRQLPGEVDRPACIRQLFGHAGSVLRQDPSLVEPIARWLFSLASGGEAPDPGAEPFMYSFDDRLDLAATGIVQEAPGALASDMGEFLAGYAEEPV